MRIRWLCLLNEIISRSRDTASSERLLDGRAGQSVISWPIQHKSSQFSGNHLNFIVPLSDATLDYSPRGRVMWIGG